MSAQLEESVASALRTAGLRPKPQWVKQAILHLSASSDQFSRGSLQQKVDMIMERFLVTDIRVTNDGTLPRNIRMWSKQKLDGNHVIQLDEVLNVAVPIKARYQSASESCLKMKISDGATDTIAVEYRQIPALRWDTPPGSKMVITDALVVNGALFLAPQNVQLIGGQVACLAAAHEAAAAICNRPAKPYQREETGSTAASQTLADRAGHAASVAYTRACQIFPQPPQAPQLNGDPISSSACFPSVQAESNLNAGNTLSSVAHSMAPVQGGDTRQDFGGYQSTRPAWENQVPSWLNKGQSAAQDTIPSASAAGKIPEAGPSNRGAFSGQISTPPVRIPTTPCVIGSQCTPQSTGQRRLKRLYSQVYTPTDTHISEEALEDDVEDKMVEEFTDLMSPPPNRKAKVFSLQQGVIDLCDSPSPLGQPGHQGPREETKIQTAPEQSNFQQTRREENGLEQRTRLQDIKLNLEDDAFMIDLSAE